jgi:hypothetical protein
MVQASDLCDWASVGFRGIEQLLQKAGIENAILGITPSPQVFQ